MRRFLLAACLVACAAPKPLPPLDVRSVAWTDVPLGKVAAVAESDDAVTVFSDRGAVVLAGGVEVAVDPSVTRWVSGATIPAADGNGTWMIGVDAAGRVYRVRDRHRLELVSPRWGLGKERVRDVVGLGEGRIAFALSSGVALTDGDKLSRYDYSFGAIAGGAGHGAGLATDGVQVFDPYHGVDRRFAVPDARFVAIDAHGKLVVANELALWVEDDPRALVVPGDPRLSLRHRAARPLHGLAASGDHVWFAEGGELGLLEGTNLTASHGAGLPESARLVGATGGDVWAIGDGRLLRYSMAKGASTFDTQVAPVARRVCAKCHGPGTMIPLVTKVDWEGMRASIEQRVVKARTMPPAGTVLSDAERASIGAWATR